MIKLPETVWIAGKGPSLDTFDWANAGDFRIGLNEAALVVPNCSAVIAKDYNVWRTLLAKLPAGVNVWMEQGIKGDNWTTWPNNPVFRWKTGVHANPGDETCPSCIRLCAYFGVKKIHFVGCDSINWSLEYQKREGKPYAKSVLDLDTSARRNFYYKPITKRIWLALKKTGIVPVWEHTKEEIKNPWLKEEVA